MLPALRALTTNLGEIAVLMSTQRSDPSMSILFINSVVAIFFSEKIAKSKLNLPNLVVLVTPIDVN